MIAGNFEMPKAPPRRRTCENARRPPGKTTIACGWKSDRPQRSPTTSSRAHLTRACSYLLACFIMTTLCDGVCGAPSTQKPDSSSASISTPTSISLQGKLVYRTTQPIGTWVLAVAKSDAVYKLPWQPADAVTGQPIPPTTWISLKCYPMVGPNATRCASIDAAAVIRPAVAPVMAATNQNLRLLVMTINLSSSAANCSGQKGMTVSEVRNLFTEPKGHADFFANCSYGKMTIDTDALTVVSTLVPCSQAILDCDHDAISLGARRQLPPGVRPSAYTHLVYVLPFDIFDKCGWVGLAEVPGTQTWFSPDLQGIFRKATVMQELLHNFGLWHGWRNGIEYGDYSTAMGTGESCPSAPELWRLGWATPLAQLSSNNFPPNMFLNFTIPATYVGPRGAMIRILPDWLGGNYKKNVYLAFRVKAGGDGDLFPSCHRRISIHDVDKQIDNSPSPLVGDPRVSLIGMLLPGTNMTLLAFQIFVIAGAALANSNTSIQVKLCRYIVTADECFDDPLVFSPPPYVSRLDKKPEAAALQPLSPSPRRSVAPGSPGRLDNTPPAPPPRPPLLFQHRSPPPEPLPPPRKQPSKRPKASLFTPPPPSSPPRNLAKPPPPRKWG